MYARIWKNIFLIATLAVATTSFGNGNDGGMSGGGGGGLVLDKDNPWFVDNTTEVKFCVELDSQVFSASMAQIQRALDSAVQYWREEYAESFSLTWPGSRAVKLATQRDFEGHPTNSI